MFIDSICQSIDFLKYIEILSCYLAHFFSSGLFSIFLRTFYFAYDYLFCSWRQFYFFLSNLYAPLFFLALSKWLGPPVQCGTDLLRLEILVLLTVCCLSPLNMMFSLSPLNAILVVGFIVDILHKLEDFFSIPVCWMFLFCNPKC